MTKLRGKMPLSYKRFSLPYILEDKSDFIRGELSHPVNLRLNWSNLRRPSGNQRLRSKIPIRAILFKMHHRSPIRRPTLMIMSLFKLYSCRSFLPARLFVILFPSSL
jgi:hypothetical protein